jgi:hypothetical protein
MDGKYEAGSPYQLQLIRVSTAAAVDLIGRIRRFAHALQISRSDLYSVLPTPLNVC